MENFFRLTHWLDTASDCDFWFNVWLRPRGIPCAIVSSRNAATGRTRYAVFREGVEAGSEKKKYNLRNTGYGVNMDPKIVASANGWNHPIIDLSEEEG